MGKLSIYCENSEIDLMPLEQAFYKILKQRINLSAELIFCSEDEIRQLNKERRNNDSVTDVLSFPTLEITAGEVLKKSNYPFDYDNADKCLFIGSIAICTNRAEEQAKEYGHSLHRELCYLTVHGLLHLMGFDHMNEQDKAVMREYEEQILALANATREQ